MIEKPANIIYGVNERPPIYLTFIIAIQHIFLISSTLVLPIVIVQEMGGSFLEIRTVVSLTIIAVGLSTVLQALTKGPIGSGYLVPTESSPSYLMVSIHAAWLGGLPLMHGMMLLAGLFEVFFSRVLRFLKFLFPVEITGLVVLMVGVNLIPLAVSKFLGINYAGDLINFKNVFVGIITLAAMIGFNIWTKEKLRLYCVLIGLIVGYVVAGIFGLFSTSDFNYVIHSPVIAVPYLEHVSFKWTFKWSLVFPFIIVSLCAALKSFGNITTAQKNNDKQWKEPNIRNISKGLFADGLGIVASGLMGGVAVDTAASCVGMSIATGVTSRYIAFAIGILCIILGFCPKMAAIFSAMPQPVMGAILIFVTSFMVLSGFQIILGSDLNAKKIFVIGISFIFGLSAEIVPTLYAHFPMWLQAVFSSSLTLATVMAIVLHQIFNIEQHYMLIKSKTKKNSTKIDSNISSK